MIFQKSVETEEEKHSSTPFSFENDSMQHIILHTSDIPRERNTTSARIPFHRLHIPVCVGQLLLHLAPLPVSLSLQIPL